MKRLTILLLVGIMTFTSEIYAQRDFCRDFLKSEQCKQFPGRKFKLNGQSRSTIIGTEDKMVYSVVLYSEMQYNIYFCTSELLKPVHFKLMNDESGDVLYDNASNNYMDYLTLKLDKTQRLKISVQILGQDMTEQEKIEFLGCLGMMIFAKKLN
ncbi:MAG: hypothetical protein K9J30_11100 [Bacteroidales bacterium]|nr:hypothetical protein [Bacteroidales bacterium]